MLPVSNPQLFKISLTAEKDTDTIIDTMKSGAADYVVKGSDDFEANLKFRINQAIEKLALLRKNQLLRDENASRTEENRKLAVAIAEQGNPHVGNTIMDADLGELVLADGKTLGDVEAEVRFTNIDGRRELYMCQRCSYGFSGNSSALLEDQMARSFKLLVGRDPVGKPTAELASAGPEWFLQKVTLTLSDSLGAESFDLGNPFTIVAQQFGDVDVFKKAQADRPGSY